MNAQEVLKELDRLYEENKRDELEMYMKENIEKAHAEENLLVELALLNEIIGYYRNISRIQESLDYCQRLIDLLKEHNLGGTIPYATSMLNVATAYRNADRHEEALELYVDVAGVYALSLDPKDIRIGALSNNICVTCLEMGKLEEAEEFAEKALYVLADQPGAESEAAVAYSNMAAVNVEKGEEYQEEAVEYLQKALKIFREHEDLASNYGATLCHLGQLYLRMEEYEKAVDAYEEALVKVEAEYGQNIPYMITCRNCALAQEKAGNVQRADELRKIADELMVQF